MNYTVVITSEHLTVIHRAVHSVGMTQQADHAPGAGWRPLDTLGVRTWLVRRQLGDSQRAFGLRCGLTFGEVQSIEAGAQVRDEVRKIKAISRGTGADETWLRDGGPLADDGRFPPHPTDPGDAPRQYSDILAAA